MELIPKTKADWKIIIAICFLFTCVVSAFLMFSTIYKALGVSESTSITIISDSNTDLKNIEVSRVSRGGALFALETKEINSWESKEWIKAIEIRSDSPLVNQKLKAAVDIGASSYNIDISTLPAQAFSERDSKYFLRIDQTLLGRTTNHIPFFTEILNWPNNSKAFSRAFIITFIPTLLFFLSALILCLVYRYFVIRNKDIFNSEGQLLTHNFVLKIACVFILSTVSVLLFINNGPTAYEWPALDMAPFFERQANQNFLPNDFFTNVSSEANPRFIFGYFVIAINKTLNNNWYDTFFFLKVLLVVFLPPLLFLTCTSFFNTISDLRRKMLISVGIFLFILASLFPIFIDQFTIALWRPYQTMVTPHTISFFFGLVAIYFANNQKMLLSIIFWFICTLFLPTIGISLLLLFFIIHWQNTTSKEYLLYSLGGVIIPGVLVAILFMPNESLSAAEFVYHYVTSNHSIHYLPSAFESAPLSPLPWYFHFIFLEILLLGAGLFGWVKSDRFLYTTAILAGASYAGAVLLCYLFIELIPVKLIAAIGPSRYTLLGYWFVTILGGYIFSYVPLRYFPFLNLLKYGRLFSKKSLLTSLSIIFILLTIGTYNTYQDNPKQEWQQTHQTLNEWITTHTQKDAVFATNIFNLVVNIPLVSKRAIFAGNGFPFHEDSFTEFDNRRSLLFGKPEDWQGMTGNSDRIKMDNFYRHLTPSDFLSIGQQYKLDYVIIEKSFSSAFSGFVPDYADKEIIIFKVASFKINN